jgi:hypothetical protein
MVKATGSIRANQSVPKLNTSSGWPDGQRALERACYLMASRPKARNQVADFCSAPMAGCYAAVDIFFFTVLVKQNGCEFPGRRLECL